MNSEMGIALTLTLLLTMSCAHTTSHESVVENAIAATIEANAPVWIHSIDGQKVRNFGAAHRTCLKILPGAHTIQVFYEGSEDVFVRPGPAIVRPRRVHSLSYLDLRLVAEPNHNYVVCFVRRGNHWGAGITEFSSANPK